MALRHAILASLSRGVPRTGYELNASFTDDADRAWHASPSQVYSELLKLESKGLIRVSERTERGRTSYAITDDGMAELRRWLIHDNPDHSIRDDAMLRLVTLWVLDDTTAGYLIDAEISHQRKRQLSLSHLLQTWDSVREDTRVWRNRRALYALWLAQAELTLSWLDGLREVLSETDEPVPNILAKHWPQPSSAGHGVRS